MKKKLSHFFICLLGFSLLSNKAYAYLDPGTGSIILQAIIAFFAGAAAFISIYWKKLKSFISNKFSKVKKK